MPPSDLCLQAWRRACVPLYQVRQHPKSESWTECKTGKRPFLTLFVQPGPVLDLSYTGHVTVVGKVPVLNRVICVSFGWKMCLKPGCQWVMWCHVLLWSVHCRFRMMHLITIQLVSMYDIMHVGCGEGMWDKGVMCCVGGAVQGVQQGANLEALSLEEASMKSD
jgi:hypothetical protein